METGELAMIAEGLERILADAPLEAIDESAGQGDEAAALWDTLRDNGYPKLCVIEEQGGFGGSFADTVSLAELSGRHALALPLVDTVLASGLLSVAHAEVPDMRLGLADPLDGSAPLPYAGLVDAALSFSDGRLVCTKVNAEGFTPIGQAEDGAAYLNGPMDDVIADTAAPDWLTPLAFQALGAFLRAAQMSGAMQAALDLTLSYTQEREQFGRPLAKFQAIQHHLSDIACETAAAIAAVEMAGEAVRGDPACGRYAIEEIAIAKIRCGQAASKVASAAHQAHGAMGFTREYALGRFTRRLWQWQDEFGAETVWAQRLGDAVLSEPVPRLWPRISQ